MYKKVAVLYDGSTESDKALSAAFTFSKSFSAQLEVIVIEPDHPVYAAYAQAAVSYAPEIIEEGRMTGYEQLRRQILADESVAEIELTFHLFHSAEDRELIALLRDSHVDLLVLGLHQRHLFISRLWNTIYALAESAPCSVFGVR